MKGVMNFSLPIFVCRSESALAAIGNNFSYAPMLFEDTEDMAPLDFMKKLCIY